MSRATCPKCGNTDVSWIRDDADYAHYICLECKQCFCYPPKTVFNMITASLEKLSDKLVYQFIAYDSHGLFVSCWRSTLTGDREYLSKSEAISATVTKLKEIVNE